MDDLLVSALGSQAAKVENRLRSEHGMIVSRGIPYTPDLVYGYRLCFKDGTTVCYGWRKQTMDGKDLLVPFEERN